MSKSASDKIIMFSAIGLVAWAFIGLPILYAPSSPAASTDECIFQTVGICFVEPTSGKVFGFAEFVQAFALLVLVYTLSDVRYRFRVATAPLPLWQITFWMSAAIGIGTLVTDFWVTQKFAVPWFLASQAYWQLVLGLMFLLMVLIWLWFAFVSPPIFGKHNALNFTRALYAYLLQGDERDLPVIAAELRRSARALVISVRDVPRTPEGSKLTASHYASDVLLLIGNRKFCRHIVASSPGTAIAFFNTMSEFRKYRIPIRQFAANLSTEALLNKDCILYHEDEGYYSGYFGYVRPFTNALYGDFDLVEALAQGNSPLDIDLDIRWTIDAKQLEAYVRAVLTTFKSALDKGRFYEHSYALYRAFDIIQHTIFDLHKLDKTSEGPEAEDIRERLRVVVHFINDAIDVLDKHGIQRTTYRHRGERHLWREDYYDHLAKLMFEVIFHAAAIKTKEFVSWQVQYSAIWAQFSGFKRSATRKIVLFKLHRLLYNEVLDMERLPNFGNAVVLGYLLNVLGLKEGLKRDYRRSSYPLRKAVISWTKRNYLWLVKTQPAVAAAALLGTISFDEQRSQLVKTYEKGLSLVAPTDTLDLDQPIGPQRPV